MNFQLASFPYLIFDISVRRCLLLCVLFYHAVPFFWNNGALLFVNGQAYRNKRDTRERPSHQ